MKLIALNGAKTVGKTTIAKALKSKNANVKIISFAKPLRDMLRAMGVEDRYLNVDKEELIPGINRSAREMLCTLGTEWGRDMIDQSIWLWAMDKQIKNVVENSESVEELIIVIDDCRFKNEVVWLKENSGKLVHLFREGVEYPDGEYTEIRAGIKYTGGHPSEIALPKELVDYEVDAGEIEKSVNFILSI